MKERKPTLSHHIQFRLFLFFSWFITLFPHALIMFVAGFVASIIGRLAPFRKKVVLKNLHTAFGDTISGSEKKRLLREATRNVIFMTMDFFYGTRRTSKWGDSVITEEKGIEHFSRLGEEHKSWIHVAPHFGSFEILSTQSHRTDNTSWSLAKPLHNKLIQKHLESGRTKHGLNILWTDDPGLMRKMIRIIRGGGQINIMADQDMRMDGIFVDFFGKPASTTKAPGWLSLKYNLPLLPVFLVRLGPTRHRLVCADPIFPSQAEGDNDDEKIWWLTQRYTKAFEDMIREYPAQYFWVHRRWKTTPRSMQKRLATLAMRRHKDAHENS